MKIFIFENIAKLTDNYHSDGGAVVITTSLDKALKLLEENKVTITKEEVDDVMELPLVDRGLGFSKNVFIFPNAGCC